MKFLILFLATLIIKKIITKDRVMDNYTVSIMEESYRNHENLVTIFFDETESSLIVLSVFHSNIKQNSKFNRFNFSIINLFESDDGYVL